MTKLHLIPKLIRISVLIFLTSFFSFSQRDFNNYQTLLSKGNMPADFSTPVSQKIANDLASNKLTFKTKTDAQKYLKEIHERLDNVLYSGSVIYGDEISTYVQQVAANLLKDDPELFKELRFYTIKSNETNAFSTSPGIIFVTTGLIAQLSSEAQLAFVLSHEIAHYEKKHTHEEYLNSQKVGEIKRREQILKLSQFSKEKELEADQLALSRYHKMGYSKEELLGTFDVLMYSYLPFDELTFPKDYFNTAYMYIPEESFNYEIKPITAEEDYNDTYSSHPNIKKRKDAVQKSVSEYTNWGNASFKLDDKLFFELRTVCRLESIRLDVIDGNMISALYSIFLMEKEFPGSFYLDKMKAITWLSLQQQAFKLEGDSQNYKVEGESSLLYNFLRRANIFEAATIGMRIIYDLRAKHPGDTFFEDTYKNYLDGFVQYYNVSLTAYQPFTYQQAAQNALNKANDTVVKKETTNLSEGSKYSRIKEKRTTIQSSAAFDSTEFSIYAISDIIRDSSFISDFKTMKAHNDSVKESVTLFNSLSKREQEKLWKTYIASLSKEEASFKKILIVEPIISLSSKNGVAEWEIKSAEKTYQKTLVTNAQKLGFEPVIMTKDSILKGTTDDFNEYSTYLAYIEQINSANNGNDCFSIDYELINQFTEARGISQILFTRIDYSYFPDFNPIAIIFGTIVAPLIPYIYFVYIPQTIKEGKNLTMYSMMINTKNGKNYSYIKNNIQKSAAVENYAPYYRDFFNLIKQF